MAEPMYTEVVKRQIWKVTNTFLAIDQFLGLCGSFSDHSTKRLSLPFSASVSISSTFDLDEDSEWSRLYCRMVDGSSSSSRRKKRPPDARWTKRPNIVSRKRSFIMRNLIFDFDKMGEGRGCCYLLRVVKE